MRVYAVGGTINSLSQESEMLGGVGSRATGDVHVRKRAGGELDAAGEARRLDYKKRRTDVCEALNALEKKREEEEEGLGMEMEEEEGGEE